MRQTAFSCVVAVVVALSTRADSWSDSQRLALNSDEHGTIADRSLAVASARKNEAENAGEFADSLSGDPDFWKGTGAGTNGRSLREEAPPRAKLIAQFPDGAVLKKAPAARSPTRRDGAKLSGRTILLCVAGSTGVICARRRE
ncbi:MAG: hypothetical protein AB7U61_11520 [Methylocystis sp.]